MCTALKDHAVQLDDAISKGEKDREVLNQLHHDKMDHFQVKCLFKATVLIL